CARFVEFACGGLALSRRGRRRTMRPVLTLPKEIMMENAPLKPGDVAPEFELMNQDKNKVKLSDFRGKKKVVLLFYPMDFSPVCTQEHCTFGPELPRLSGNDDAVMFGVSCDSPFCHAAFRRQYNIPYDLLADPTRKMVKAYDMWAGEE